MPSYSVAQAKTQLSKLIDEAQAGETVTITRHVKPAAELRAPTPARRKPTQEEIATLMEGIAERARLRPSLGESAADIIRKMRDGDYR